jgi:hypothetical protein
MGTKGRHYQPIDRTHQVVGRAGFLLESGAESRMVYPGENEVSVQADGSLIGVERSGQNLDFVCF